MYSERERSLSSAKRLRASSSGSETYTRMASVFFSGTEAMDQTKPLAGERQSCNGEGGAPDGAGEVGGWRFALPLQNRRWA